MLIKQEIEGEELLIIKERQGNDFRNMSYKSEIIGTMRNTILLSVLLGLPWITSLIPTSQLQQYISVILNASTGFYILAYSMMANKQGN